MTLQIEGERKPELSVPDSWIDAFVLANKTAPQDIFLENILVGEKIVCSIASGEVSLQDYDALSPSMSQAERLAGEIDETHQLFGVKAQLPPELLIDIWCRVYNHIETSIAMLGEVTDEKIANLARIYAAAVDGINTSKAQESAALYRASLNLDSKTFDERFDKTLLRDLYESMYGGVDTVYNSILESGEKIPEKVIKGFRNEYLGY